MLKSLKAIHQRMDQCEKCPNMCSRAVYGPALETKVMLIGQAPGVHESSLGRPFAFTAGKTLFKWLGKATGADETELREMIYFSAVARCFPGKTKAGQGDRVPTPEEIKNCSEYLRAEVEILKPKLILAVGKVAMMEVLSAHGIKTSTPLTDLVGKKIKTHFHGHEVTVISLPHPSGVSRWPQTEPGKSKLAKALRLLRLELQELL
jgi:uracil-DNA glycosylase